MMTNEHAINWLLNIKDHITFGGNDTYDALRIEAIDLAITALKKMNGHDHEGEWICTFHSTFPQYEPDIYRCSICNSIGNKTNKFCNICGADMRGEEE